MKRIVVFFFSAMLVMFALSNHALAKPPKHAPFKRVFMIVFENSEATVTLQQPTFKQLSTQGAYFTNFHAITHPSQPNYIAMTSGSTQGITDDKPYTIDAQNIVDLLENKKISWKVYAENFPGNCSTVEKTEKYARNHNPFISYKNIVENPKRCANIVEGGQFNKDLKANDLPDFSFYIPNIEDNGHNTGVAFADNWLKTTIVPLFSNPNFFKDTLVIITFDEGDNKNPTPENLIYTLFYGDMVKTKMFNTKYNFYNLLRTLEDEWELGTLKKYDATAQPISDVWKKH